VALAIVAHVGPLAILLPAMLLVPAFRRRWSGWTEGAPPGYLAICSLAVIALTLTIRHPAPYPRVFVVFFPLITFSLFRILKGMPLFRNARQVRVLAMVILLFGVAWERAAAALTGRQVLAGEHPQNLLQQYYRGSVGLSRICSRISRSEVADRTVVLVDFFDFPSFRFYWSSVFQMPPDRILVENRNPKVQWEARFKRGKWRVGAVAANWEDAGTLFADAGCSGPFVLAFAARDRGFFVRGQSPE